MENNSQGTFNGYLLLSLMLTALFAIVLLIFGDPTKMSIFTYSAFRFFFIGVILVPVIFVLAWKTRKGLVKGIAICLCQWFGMLIIYENLDAFTYNISTNIMDPVLRAWDSKIFGETPSIIIDKMGLVNPILTLIFSYIYTFVYVLFPPLFAVYLIWKGENTEFSKYLCLVSVVTLTAFLIYFFVPAVGPNVYYGNEYKTSLGDNNNLVVNLPEYPKSTFPSMHTGLLTIFSIFVYRNSKKLFAITLPIVIALFASTIYLRQHYFIDLIAAWVLVFVAYNILMHPSVEKKLSKPLDIVKIVQNKLKQITN